MSYLHIYVVEKHSFAPAGSGGQICTPSVQGTDRQVEGVVAGIWCPSSVPRLWRPRSCVSDPATPG